MRVLVLCIVALCAAVASHGIEANDYLRLRPKFTNTNMDDFKIYIQRVRRRFASTTHNVYGMPVMKHSVPNSHRFYLMNLTTASDEMITIGVDFLTLEAAAYRPVGTNQSYFFPNAPQVAFDLLFSDTHKSLLGFDNTFQSIENAAGTTRQGILLGDAHLESAIANLYHYRPGLVAVSFLVITQMVLEALKFKSIEQTVANSLNYGYVFKPDLHFVSLQDNWSQLSLQIQASTSTQGVFQTAVRLYNTKGEVIDVDSVYYPMVIANVALQLRRCELNNYIKMLPGRADELNSGCYVEASSATRISGREGFCVSVAGELSHDGSRLISFPCGQVQVNQKWTFHSDQTIRSSGKCLAANKWRFGNSLVIYDCSKVAREDITWDVSVSGAIMNPSNGLVLSSKSTKLTMEVNEFDSSQGWRVGNYVKPIVVTIVGLGGRCLKASDDNKNMWLEYCDDSNHAALQSWALYSDGTIRVHLNRRLCVGVTSSNDTNSYNDIVILVCDGSANQRWVLNADGTLSTATNETLVMDVAQSNVKLQKIILYPRNGEHNQQWVVLY